MQSSTPIERLSDTEIGLAISALGVIDCVEDATERMAMQRWFLIRHGEILLPAFEELRNSRAQIRKFVRDFEEGRADFVSVDRLAQAVR